MWVGETNITQLKTFFFSLKANNVLKIKNSELKLKYVKIIIDIQY